MLRSRGVTLVLLLLLGAGCSTTEYAAPIKAFKDSADAAAKSYGDMNTALAQATLAYAVQSAARDPANNNLQRTKDDCGAYAPGADVRCRAVFSLSSPLGPAVTLERDHYTSPLSGMLDVLTATQGYAGNLAAVQEANTVAEVNTSLDKIQANLAQLAKAANGGQASPLPQAAGQAVRWVFGQYIESVKLNALRDATAAARQPLAFAKEAFRSMEESAKIILTASSEKAARDSFLNMTPTSESSIRATLAAQNAYDDLLTAPMSPMFDNLVDAHDDLADALESGSHLSVRNALSRFGEIQKQAATLEKIAKDLLAALEE